MLWCVHVSYMFTCVCVHVWTVHMCMHIEFTCWLLVSSYITICSFFFQDFYLHLIIYLCPWKPEEDVGSIGAGVLDTPLDLDTGNWTQLFQKKTESSFNHWVICTAPLPLIIETRSLIKSRDHKLGKTNWPVNLRNSPVTSTASLCLALYMGATVLNSGAGACTGDTLLTWYFSRPKMQVNLAFALNLSQVIALIPRRTLLLRKRFVDSLRENLLHVTFWTCLIKNKQVN